MVALSWPRNKTEERIYYAEKKDVAIALGFCLSSWIGFIVEMTMGILAGLLIAIQDEQSAAKE